VPIRGRRIGVSRERIRPGKLLPKQLATGAFTQIYRICEKVRLTTLSLYSIAHFLQEREKGGLGAGTQTRGIEKANRSESLRSSKILCDSVEQHIFQDALRGPLDP
jgi:hypothetical protein